MEKFENLENLKIIKDEPIEWLNEDTKEDFFNHESMANILNKTIHDNTAPLTIGLFGGWGVGKSSIINLLKKQILKPSSNYKFIYFNAWQYSSDSFRRQFLIKLAEDLIEDKVQKDDEVDRLRKLNYAKILEDDDSASLQDLMEKARSYGFCNEIKKIHKRAFQNLKVSDIGYTSLYFCGIFMLITILIVILGFLFNDNELKRWSVVTFLLSVASFFIPKAENIFVIKKREVFDAKLIFPEQFEAEYDRLISKYTKPEENIVIVVDDLDRCESDNVKEILISLKNYLSNKKCFYILPMDDSSVVRMFKGENINFGYEQLRKYFNLSVRIPIISTEDLTSFARSIAKDYNISVDIVFIAALGHCSDARKIKHFLNLFKIKYALAQEREGHGFLSNINTLKMQMQLAKIVVLEYQYPEFYNFVSNNPDFFKIITLKARNVGDDEYSSDELSDQISLFNEKITTITALWRHFPGLKEFLIQTYDIEIDNFDLISKLKISNSESDLNKIGLSLPKILEGKEYLTTKQKEIIGNEIKIVEVLKKYMSDNILLLSNRSFDASLFIIDEIKIGLNLKIDLIRSIILNKAHNKGKFILNGDNYYILYKYLDKLESATQTKELTDFILTEVLTHEKIFFPFSIFFNHTNFNVVLTSAKVESDFFPELLNNLYERFKETNLNEYLQQIIKLNPRTTIDLSSSGIIKNLMFSFKIAEDNFVRNRLVLLAFLSKIIRPHLSNFSLTLGNFLTAFFTNKEVTDDNSKDLGEFYSFTLKIYNIIPEQSCLDIITNIDTNFENIQNDHLKNYLLLIKVGLKSHLNNLNSSLVDNNYQDYYDGTIKLDPHELSLHFLYFKKYFKNNLTVEEIVFPELLNKLKEFLESNVDVYDSELLEKAHIFRNNLDNKTRLFEFILFIISKHSTEVFDIWKDYVYNGIKDSIQNDEFQIKILIDLLDDSNIEESFRLEIGDLIFKLISKEVDVPRGQIIFEQILGNIMSGDEVFINYLNGYLDSYESRLGKSVSDHVFQSILDNILNQNLLTDYKQKINLLLKSLISFNHNLEDKIISRLINDLNNTDLDFEHRRILIVLSKKVRNIGDNELLKDAFKYYLENGDMDDLKSEINNINI